MAGKGAAGSRASHGVLHGVLSVLFHLASTTTTVSAATNATADNGTVSAVAGPTGVVPLSDELIPKSVIAVAILAGAVAIGAIVAKIVDFIHDRKSLQDDASDMSEYTRVLLKKRLALMAFTKSPVGGGGDEENDDDGIKLPPEVLALKMGKQWSLKASQRKLARETSQTDVEKGDQTGDGDAGLLAYTATSGGPVVTDLLSTSCEIAGVSMASTTASAIGPEMMKTLTTPIVAPLQQTPSLTLDELDDDVFLEEAASPKSPGGGATVSARGKDTLVVGAVCVGRTSTPVPPPAPQTPQQPPTTPATQSLAPIKSVPSSSQSPTHPTSPPRSPLATAAGAWLFTDTNRKTPVPDIAPVHGPARPQNAAAVQSAVVAVNNASGSGSMTSVRHDERPVSPLGGVDVPERPSNPEPPTSPVTSPTPRVASPTSRVASPTSRVASPTSRGPSPTSRVTSPTSGTASPDNMAFPLHREPVSGVNRVTDAEAKRPVTAGKSRTANNKVKSQASKSAFSSSKADIRKIFQKAPVAKRPQTGKKSSASAFKTGPSVATEDEGPGGASVAPKRPKTAGPMRTGNRPVSAKPSRKITPGVRLKSAKR